MIKHYTLLLLLALAMTPATARQRTKQEIQSIAQRLILSSSEYRAKVASKGHDESREELKEVAATANYTVMAYDRGGFAIIANDDANNPVIGYSSTSSFSTSNPALAWYLSIADATLSSKDANAMKMSAVSIPAGCKNQVDHLIKTKWNQNDPYWDKCPTDGTGKHCWTGCVATAMAQIMYYYKYPTKGKGKASVIYNGKSYDVDFGAGSGYDYDNMLTTYSNSYTPAQKFAVATLMYHCGVAAKMNYGSGDKNGSGAWLTDAADGLYQYFGYEAKYYGYRADHDDNNKTNYDDNTWYGLVYKELSDGHPILYSGSSSQGTVHCFVLDGYDKSGNVGVNWGYSGSGDGYFSLDVLGCSAYNPSQEFRWWQDMVVIHKPNGSTGIESVTAPRPTDGKKYDLSGREITTPTKGIIYIENGKKHIQQ